MMTLGSLFDGAGTMPFAAMLCGIKPVWSSEIEKFPCEVTKKRFPDVRQLGDVTKINGAEIEPVDIITFGSPCQDLSVAGQRAGLKGERSGLFMEAVRIIKEMRQNAIRTNQPVRPRYAVWENVPGAYSSSKGEDFRVVLEELCKVVDREVSIPRPTKGKWERAGAIVGNAADGTGYSVAWRTLDAQYWGVPQRRRRIWLVADFGGESAPEILFKREGLRRDFAKSRAAWERVAETAEGSAGRASVWDGRGNGNGRIAPTQASDHNNRSGDFAAVVVQGFDVYNQRTTGNKTKTLVARHTDADAIPAVFWGIGNGQADGTGLHEKVESLNCMHDAQAVIAIDRAAFNQGMNAQYDIGISEDGVAQTVVAKGPGAICDKKIRRLTPTECARLQGMPSWWCADIPHSDSAEYKMWGNGMALPNALYVMEGFIETKEAKND